MVAHCGCSASLRACASIWNDFSGGTLTTIHSPKFIYLGRGSPIVPMKCPKCSSKQIRAAATNGHEEEVITRKRKCVECGHSWFTVEMIVTPVVVGWRRIGRDSQSKPVLRMPLKVVLQEEDG